MNNNEYKQTLYVDMLDHASRDCQWAAYSDLLSEPVHVFHEKLELLAIVTIAS